MLKKLLFVGIMTSLVGLSGVAMADIPPPDDGGSDAAAGDAAPAADASTDASAAGDSSTGSDASAARDGSAAADASPVAPAGGDDDDDGCSVGGGTTGFGTLAFAGLGLAAAVGLRRRRR